jgi:ribonuclease P protein component
MDQSLPKSEKIKSHLEVQRIFATGTTWQQGPLKAFWVWEGSGLRQFQVAFLAPKRRFPRAVDRNRIKRVMREAYRTTRPNLPEVAERKILFLFTGRRLPKGLEMKALFERFWKELPPHPNRETNSL